MTGPISLAGSVILIGIAILVPASWECILERRARRARRAALMARAPSRERVKALMDRLPPCDEWLDDRYDAKPPETMSHDHHRDH